ncbi:MAG TPA: RodZ domain-containing protein [Methylomirabilota bacterium]|nr:RodZ domain-containing protein [Methylomirabilota bacterium]
MASLGPYLRELRERRGLSLEEMVRATRVASRYLEALEAEDLRALPAPTFVRGFIRAWCQTVGVDATEALARYQELSGAPMPGATRPAAEVAGEHELPAGSRNRGAVLVSFVLLVILGLALFAVTLVLQSGRDRAERRAGSPPGIPAAAAPPASTSGTHGGGSPSDEGAAATKESPSASGRRPEPAAAPQAAGRAPVAVPGSAQASPSPGGDSAGTLTPRYRLVARVSEPTWIRVRMEEGRATEETIPAGQTREWVSNAPFVLTVGNAGGVTLELNGRALPSLGARGAVISRLVIPPAAR